VDPIDCFRGNYAFLSMLQPCELIGAYGIRYHSGEAAFQAGKTLDVAEKRWIAHARTAAEAKRRGRRVTLVDGWDETRHRVMVSVNQMKFSDPVLSVRLRATGAALLVEGNVWHDQFWGDCRCGRARCAEPGQNWLGRHLMRLRAELARA
jgi:ribA/ribD-fused uncharacterized protein